MVKIVHEFNGKKIEKDSEVGTFLLSNNMGGYVSFPDEPLSKHQGLVFYDGLEHFKLIDDIKIRKDLKKIINHFTRVEREYADGVNNTIIFPSHHNSLIFELNKREDIELILDCRKADDMRQFGRYYDVYEEDGKIMIEFTKKTDISEDLTRDEQEFKIFLVLHADTGTTSYLPVKTWFEEKYEYDEHNPSGQLSRYVYHALTMKCRQLICSFGTTKTDALHELEKVMERFDKVVKEEEKAKFLKKHFTKLWASETDFAKLAAINSLLSLHQEATYNGIYAGFYWFRQYWSRDELISLKGFINMGDYAFVKKVIFRWLELIQPDGRLPNRYPASRLGSADSIGWLFKRIDDYLNALEKSKCIYHYISLEDLIFMKEKAERVSYDLLEHYSDGPLIKNSGDDTWMDTCDEAGIPRDGARLEIQALQLCIYKVMKRLCRLTDDHIGERMAEGFERELKHEVKNEFWNLNYLKDGPKDDTIRPNIFIVYYVYPELLSKSEWTKCFDMILPKLWLEWGGLSTIDKTNPEYQPKHIGEGSKSYHNGDSWFWINNLAAYCLQKHAGFRYRKYIEDMTNASIKEILWMGIPGHHAEISSADKLSSYGCFVQAWSAAMLLELLG